MTIMARGSPVESIAPAGMPGAKIDDVELRRQTHVKSMRRVFRPLRNVESIEG
jgi:hypothetical protein